MIRGDRLKALLVIFLLSVLVLGCSKLEDNITGDSVAGVSGAKLFSWSLVQKIKDLLSKYTIDQKIDFKLLNKVSPVYSNLPRKDYVTKVKAWKIYLNANLI
ncbi:MAG: hypothetical protein AABX13_06170 [Nanoarchaeota archaeon]